METEGPIRFGERRFQDKLCAGSTFVRGRGHLRRRVFWKYRHSRRRVDSDGTKSGNSKGSTNLLASGVIHQEEGQIRNVEERQSRKDVKSGDDFVESTENC